MPIESSDPEKLEKQAAESILGDSSLSDELTDDEAKPLLAFALSQAAALARRVAAQAAGETMEDSLGDVRKLTKRINRFVGSRTAGDDAAMRKNLDRLAKVSEEMYGSAAPRPTPEQLEAFLSEQANLNTTQVVTRLLAMYAPPPPQLAAPEPSGKLTAPEPPSRLGAPPAPEQLEGPESPSLLPHGEDEKS